jgi:hypothetical protein
LFTKKEKIRKKLNITKNLLGKNTSNIIFYLCYNTLRVIKEENLLTNELIEAIEEFEKLKGIPKEMIISSLEDAIRIAYKKNSQIAEIYLST